MARALNVTRIRLLLTVSLALVVVCSAVDASRILGIFPFQGHSHWAVYKPLMVGLAKRGHEVTVLGHFPLKQPIPSYKDISLNGTLPPVINNVTFEVVQDMRQMGNFMSAPLIWHEAVYDICEVLYKTEPVQKLLKSTEKYDLIIIEIFGTECFLGFVHKFGVPYIGLISSVMLPWSYDIIDLPNNPSYVPNYLLPNAGSMDLLARMTNVLVQIGSKLGYEILSRRPSEKIARQYFPDTPSYKSIANNISLLITNSHFSINGAAPGVPALVEVGGIHIEDLKPLPKNLEYILGNATKGVIYFSFGSMVQMETFPQSVLQAFIQSFANIAQTILWKVDADHLPKPLPKNIITSKWLPQLEMLCHPNTVGFITHGGLLGLQEAVHCGVPIIGIPLFADQMLNVKSFVRIGIAIELVVEDLTQESVSKALDEIRQPEYKENAKRISKLFGDRLIGPLDTAIYWTEYILRYNGAPHLRTSAKNLSWYQLYLIDVFLIFALTIYLIFKVIKLLIKLLCAKVKKNKVKVH